MDLNPKNPSQIPGSSPNGPFGDILSPSQMKLVGFAITFASFMAVMWLASRLLDALAWLVAMFSHVIWPLAVAGILALLVRPIVKLFEERLNITRLKAIALSFCCLIIVIVALLSFFLPLLIDQILSLVYFLIDFMSSESLADITRKIQEGTPERLKPIVSGFFENESIKSFLNTNIIDPNMIAERAMATMTSIRNWLSDATQFLVMAAIVPVYLFFFLLVDKDPSRDMEEELSYIVPKYKEDIVFLINEFINIIISFFRGQMLISLIMGLMMGIGFWLIGLKFGFILGLIAGLLNIVPYLGTMIGLATILPLAFFQEDGGFLMLVLASCVFALVQSVEGYFLTPKIMGDRTGLHPLTVIISIFFWGTLFSGILGMILAIPLTAFFIVAWRLLKLKYLERVHA